MKNMNYLTRLILCSFALLWSGMIVAQTTISGVVKDTEGTALIGANLVVDGTTDGTVSDFDGSFSIK